MKKIICSLLLSLAMCPGNNARAQYIYTIAGNGVTGYTDAGGNPKQAEFNHPWGLAFDRQGDLYIADHVNAAIRKINTAGVISTFAGTTVYGYCGDDSAACEAKMERPGGVVANGVGDVFVADGDNNRVRQITNGVITTLAGTGAAGYTGDGSNARHATMRNPKGIAVDAFGNMYIADSGNNVIRKIDISGIISTFAGTGERGYTGDGGPASAATFSGPIGVTVDASGNIWVADALNNAVRKIDGYSHIITTFAGMGIGGYNGDGNPATATMLSRPNSIAVDKAGNVYISDEGNNIVRMVNRQGYVTTVAGNGTAGYSGDGGIATQAELYRPMGLAIDSNGNLYVGDFINNVVRMVTIPPARTAVAKVSSINEAALTIYPDPADGYVNVAAAAVTHDNMEVYVCNMLGQVVNHCVLTDGKAEIDVSLLPRGCYIVNCLSNGERIASERFAKD